ncbi:MAG TPA: hypothetical protein VMB51_11065 [Solirubrobacteraceae bacterium]|nr:hypothetical protein [Solirubrobacteraceae bacterium]
MIVTRQKSAVRRAYAPLAALLIVSSLLFAADVDGQAPATPPCPPAAQPSSPASASPNGSSSTGLPAPPPTAIITCVGSRAITGATFEHWLGVAQKSEPQPGKNKPASTTEEVKEVMDFLISGYWVLGQAQALHIHLSAATVRKSFERIRKQEFPKHGEFGKFLEESGQTPADLMLRVRLNLLSERIQKRVLAGHQSARSRTLALQRFLKRFKTEWPAKTYCEPAYAVKDCGHVQSPL